MQINVISKKVNRLIDKKLGLLATNLLLKLDSIVIANCGNKSPEFAEVLELSGRLATLENKFELANKYLLEALSIKCDFFRKVNINSVKTISELGKLYLKQAKYDSAEIYLKEALMINEKLLGTSNLEFINSQYNLFCLYTDKKDFNESEIFLNKFYKFIDDNYGFLNDTFIKYYVNIGSYYSKTNRKEIGENILLKSYKWICSHYSDTDEMVIIINNDLANHYHSINKYENALQLHLPNLIRLKSVYGENSYNYAKLAANSISSLIESGLNVEAKDLAQKVLKITTKTIGINNSTYAITLSNLISVNMHLGLFSEAIENGKQALRIKENLWGTNNNSYLSTLLNLSSAYIQVGDYNMAKKTIVAGLEIIKSSNKDLKQFQIYLNFAFGDILQLEKQINEARVYYQKNDSLISKYYGEASLSYIHYLTRLGVLEIRSLEYHSAQNLFKRSNTLIDKYFSENIYEKGINFHNIGICYAIIENFDSAIANSKMSVDLLESQQKGFDSEYIFAISDLLLFNIAQHNYNDASSLTVKILLLIQHKFKYVFTHLTDVEFNSYYPKYGEILNHIYLNMKNLQNKENDVLILTFNTSVLFRQALAERQKDVNIERQNSEENFNNYSYYKKLSKLLYLSLIAQDSNKIAYTNEIKNKLDSLEKILLKNGTKLDKDEYESAFIEIQKKLKSTDIFVEFINYSKRFESIDSIFYGVFVISPNIPNPIYIPLFDAGTLNIHGISEGLILKDSINSIYSYSKNKRNIFFELIWKPIFSKAGYFKSVYFSPCGILNKMNMIPICMSDDKYSLNKYNMTQISNPLYFFTSTSKNVKLFSNFYTKNVQFNFVLFGGINYDYIIDSAYNDNLEFKIKENSLFETSFKIAKRGLLRSIDNWAFLPGTSHEVNSINRIVTKCDFQSNAYTGNNATEENIKSIASKNYSPRVLHISTHGYYYNNLGDTVQESQTKFNNSLINSLFSSSDNPMIRSGLILAGGNYAWKNGHPYKEGMEDGILTAYEVSQMNLSNTELVVLSACETGLGDIQGNEGVFGLQRAFKIAGAKYLIMSLWKIPDEETVDFMITFYKNWLNKKMTIPEAFRKTQNKMRKKYKDPSKWAGFVLIQ